MRPESKSKRALEAFKQYTKGVQQKVIAINLGVTEKSITTWKRKYKWEEKLQAQEQTKITEAYLLVSENIRQGVHIQTKEGQLPKEKADKLNQALTTIYQVLSDNYLM